MRGRSTLQQLLLYFDHIYNSVSSGCQVDAIYLDIRKAFDSVPHCEWLLKLWKIGISDKLWNCFRCYLSNRLQCVTISNSHSDLLPVLSGVPQGESLGQCYLSFTSMICHRLAFSLKYSYLLMMQNCVKVFLMLLTLHCYSMIYIIYKFGVLRIISNLIFLSVFPSALIVSSTQLTLLILNYYHNWILIMI